MQVPVKLIKTHFRVPGLEAFWVWFIAANKKFQSSQEPRRGMTADLALGGFLVRQGFGDCDRGSIPTILSSHPFEKPIAVNLQVLPWFFRKKYLWISVFCFSRGAM